jgi:hypothetical protein
MYKNTNSFYLAVLCDDLENIVEIKTLTTNIE